MAYIDGKEILFSANVNTTNIALAHTLEGGESDKAPSVKAVNDGLRSQISNSLGQDRYKAASQYLLSLNVSDLWDGIYGLHLSLELDPSTFVLTATLKDRDGDALGEPQTIDLPIESVVVNATTDENGDNLILTLQNGNTLTVSLEKLISGFVTKEQLEKAIMPTASLSGDERNKAPSVSAVNDAFNAVYEEIDEEIYPKLEVIDRVIHPAINQIRANAAIVEKRLENLEYSTLAYTEDKTVAYEKAVPSGVAPYALLKSVGGSSVVVDGAFQHAAVTAVESVGADGTTVLGTVAISEDIIKEIEARIPISEDGEYSHYGVGYSTSYKNDIIWRDGRVYFKYYCRCVILDGSDDEGWGKRTTGMVSGGKPYFWKNLRQDISCELEKNNAINNTYEIVDITRLNTVIGMKVDTYDGNYSVIVRTSDVDDLSAADFKARLAENPLVVVYRKTDEEIDITDLFPSDSDVFKVEVGGKIRFVNDHQMSVPNTITYVTRKE